MAESLTGKYFIPAPLDLVENAILIMGEDDGRFDESDYIIFYGRGVNFWEYNLQQ
jgi:hypothetical protein